MKCPVCNSSFQGGECPVCRFPVVESPDVDALLRMLQPAVGKHRKDFLKRFRLEAVSFRWKEENGRLTPDGTAVESFGDAHALLESPRWLETAFARDPSRRQLSLRVRVLRGEEARELDVAVPNLKEAALQKLGAAVEEDLTFRLLLKNDRGGQTASEKTPLLAPEV